ncbi:IS1 family transposase [Piscirickettsia salmonis]|uniref:IS1/IS1595 family N-terminal zinc-binding domain-containing protein n=1 Tax=Piscirickettsia salmonis TaxID=1238 RepID=UPI003751AFB5
MPHIEVNCPQCSENNVIKFGRNASGNQRYKCKNTGCDKDTFLLNYKRPGDLPETRKRRYLGRYFAHPMMQNRRAKRDDYKPSAVRVTQRYVP